MSTINMRFKLKGINHDIRDIRFRYLGLSEWLISVDIEEHDELPATVASAPKAKRARLESPLATDDEEEGGCFLVEDLESLLTDEDTGSNMPDSPVRSD